MPGTTLLDTRHLRCRWGSLDRPFFTVATCVLSGYMKISRNIHVPIHVVLWHGLTHSWTPACTHTRHFDGYKCNRMNKSWPKELKQLFYCYRIKKDAPSELPQVILTDIDVEVYELIHHWSPAEKFLVWRVSKKIYITEQKKKKKELSDAREIIQKSMYPISTTTWWKHKAPNPP